MSGEQRNTDGQTFKEWKRAVNSIVVAKLGVGTEDLPDYRYYDDWENDLPATETAGDVVYDNVTEMGFDYNTFFEED